MKWLDMAVTPKFSWPNEPVELSFEGYTIVLQPSLQEPEDPVGFACSVSVYDPNGTTFEVGGTVISRFLSRLAWSQGGGVIELFSIGSNNQKKPGRLGQGTYRRSVYSQIEPWNYLYLPAAQNMEADLALGLFREGMSVNSAPFAFLSYFKILNIRYGNGLKQINWINRNLQSLRCSQALNRLSELKRKVSDIGKYLYEEGRCAVAHANGNPLVNPDNYGDKRRMELDLNLMKEIATLFVEREYGVLSDSSFRRSIRERPEVDPSELLIRNQQHNGKIIYESTNSSV